MRKSYKGIVEYSFSLYLLFVVILVVLYSFRMELLSAVRRQSEDSLVSANLAAAVIDMKLYDEENLAVISDAEEAYAHYLKALKENLGLREDMTPENDRLIKSAVKVESFDIYNVYGDDIECVSIRDGAVISRSFLSDGKGVVRTPTGKVIEYSGVYSRIGFEIESLFGQKFYVRKDNCVDIAAEFEKEEEDEEKEGL